MRENAERKERKDIGVDSAIDIPFVSNDVSDSSHEGTRSTPLADVPLADDDIRKLKYKHKKMCMTTGTGLINMLFVF